MQNSLPNAIQLLCKLEY